MSSGGRRGRLMVNTRAGLRFRPVTIPARGTALCSWARHFTLIVPLATQVYKWVATNYAGGKPCDGLASHPGGHRNIPNRLMQPKCYRNRDKLRGSRLYHFLPRKRIDLDTDTLAILNFIVSISYYGMPRGKFICSCPLCIP